MTDASKDGEKQLPTSGSRELQTSDKVSSPQHVRSDSAYSVDSFVIDAASNWSDAADDMLDKAATQAQRIRTMGEHASSPSPQQQQQETIGYARLNNGQSSSDSGKPPPPAHPFFNAPFYNSHWNGNDSDVSDGSFIYNHTPQKPQQAAPTATPAAPNDQRDRFPSFDSMGSSGSLVQNVVSRSTQPAGPTISSPAPPTSNSQTILPYHERRKLMQQRQNKHQHQHHRPHQQQPQHYRQQQQGQQHQYQQQQQQHQHQNRDQTPPRPGRHPQLPTPQPFYAVPQLPFVTPPHHQQLGFAPFPPHPFGFLPPPPPHLFPFPSPGMPSIVPLQPFSPHPADYHRPQDPHLLQQQQPFMMGERQPTTNIGSKAPSSHYARPPVQKLQPYGSGTGDHMLQWQTSSSLDSSDGMEQRNVCRQDVRFASAGSGPPLLRNHYSDPPPPPPPQLPTTHIRQDSAGSISSLGSLDRSGRENNLAVRDERSFLERLRPWSSPPKQYNVSDFHRKNQDFLSTMERKSSRNSPSPRPISRRVPLNAMDTPPPSRGGHRRLNSIENDDWTERDGDELQDERYAAGRRSQRRTVKTKQSTGETDNDAMSEAEEYTNDRYNTADERTHLLPPSGISTNEYADSRQHQQRHRAGRSGPSSGFRASDELKATSRINNTTSFALYELEQQQQQAKHARRKRKKAKRRASRASRHLSSWDTSESSSSSSSMMVPAHERDTWAHSDNERSRDIKWCGEGQAKTETNRLDRRLWRHLVTLSGNLAQKLFTPFAWGESFFANLPLTIGAIALSTATLGVDWFKFAEENMDSCQPVHFHSAQCSFPEFPGCFYCDTSARLYKVAEYFHFGCSCFAGLLALSLFAKLILARRVVFDELSSPTTASPAGLLCMTLDIVFAGRGAVGMVIVCASSFVHLCLAIWFMYMAFAYHALPDPSWFPNTTGIGVSAVKLWLYHPMCGHFLMAISLLFNLFCFPISVLRVFYNKKISATVGWMQMSAPNVSLYAATIMAQPSFQEETPDINSFQRMHRMIYLPCLHILFSLCIVGMTASVYSLIVRWNGFRKLPFSPAHAAFCAPCLSHANAVQAYRAAVLSFSNLPSGSPFLIILYNYWLAVLIGGTCVTVCITATYLTSLPRWTHFDLEDEIEPPAPYETAMSLSNMISSGETLVQPFVSPAILQANETGALVLTRDAEGVKYVRTRKITAFGFEPIMDSIEVDLEREFLLDWVGKNAPRRRHRTLSVPGIDFSYGSGFGSGNLGVYGGLEEGLSRWSRRRAERSVPRKNRSYTLSPFVLRKQYEE